VLELGKNPYGEIVVEDLLGHRYVATFLGYLPEAELEPARALRAKNSEAVKLAAQSLAWEDISASFGHSLLRAHHVWTAPAGSPAGDKTSAKTDPGAIALARFAQVARGDTAVMAVRSGFSLPSRPQWERAILTNAGNGPRALLVGMLRRHLPTLEWGATRPENAINIETWTAAAPSLGFRLGSAPAAAESAVYWHSPGSPAASLDIVSRYPNWAVVSLDLNLSWSPCAPHSKVRIFHKGRFVAWYFFSAPVQFPLPDNQPKLPVFDNIELLQFAGPEPAVRAEIFYDEDDFGRVPYIPVFPGAISGAHAPRRMARAMEAGSRYWCASASLEVLSHRIGVSEASLGDALTPEQCDALSASLVTIDDKKGFLLTDETGFGKGRVLASLMLAAINDDAPIVFITKSPELVSDIYRDLLDVSPLAAPLPELRHANGSILNPSGVKVVQGLPWPSPSKGKAKQKASNCLPGQPARIIATTYSQLSRSDAPARRAWLQEQLGENGWLILDEAHSAAGDSATGEQLAILCKTAKGVVFASATFARHEQNLTIYSRVLDLPEWQQKILRHALAGDHSGHLREALAHDLARQGRLLRREHPAIPPPPVLWVELDQKELTMQKKFATAWQAIFSAIEAKEAQSGENQSLWMLLGGALARSVREWNMLSKMARLEEEIVAAVARGKKPVVSFELTFEAPLREAFEQLPELTKAPLWRQRLTAVLSDALGQSIQDASSSILAAEVSAALLAIEELPPWPLDILDGLAARLTKRGIKVAELSGRSATIISNNNGFILAERKSEKRQKIVRDFNSGAYDALLLSRAGSTGISLHAGVRFSDQRQRFMIEWDIPASPIERQQFWGRVRRRDQVLEPQYASLALDTPEDRRILERENRKLQKLQAHAGRAAGPPELPLVSRAGELAVIEWAQDRPHLARRIGALYPVPEEPLGRAERALARGLILPSDERYALWERQLRAVDLGSDWEWRAHHDPRERPSRSYRRQWWWGSPSASAKLSLELVERTWSASSRPSPQDMLSIIEKHAKGFSDPPSLALEAWSEAIKQETSAGEPATFVRRSRWHDATRILAKMERGEGIFLTDPGTGEGRRAMVLGASFPSPASFSGASRFAPSQLSLWVWMVGEQEPLQVSLLRLAVDSFFKRTFARAPSFWFAEPPAPLVAVVVEGYSPAAAAWGNRFGDGRLLQVDDAAAGEGLAWVLPSRWSWQKMLAFPRDLLDAVQWMDFWRHAPDCPVQVVAPNGKSWEARPRSGAVDWSGGNSSWRELEQFWGVNIQRRTSRLRDSEFRAAPGWTCHSTLQDVRALAHAWEALGCVARIPARYEPWLRQNSTKRFAA
jgi:hypothetical protein